MTNLLANADFIKTDGKSPAGWFTWQAGESDTCRFKDPALTPALADE